ncbi:MAG: pyruvate dehydrogenase complex dihydrolipoamide acetyltransferase [Gemmatimonadota bacterium]|nr:pyruvate dehydrogenase complex dihydrolipoamide acetyltransferase [Gemmatimonadota bacterium]
MATKVTMEALSPTMEEGRLVKWLKQEGDAIAKGDVLAEVETDKAVMELVARGDGVLRKRVATEGDTAAVGTLLAVIGDPSEDITALVAGGGAGAPAAGAKPRADVIAPGQKSAGATPLPEAAGQSQGEASAPPQEKSPARIGNAAPKRQPPPRPQPATEQAAHAGNGEERQRSSPVARRMASERGVDLGNVHGSGPGGRIIKRDVEAAAATGGTVAAPVEMARAGAPVSAPARAPREGDFQDVPLSQIRKTIAKRLSESLGPIPTFYLTVELDMGRVSEMRSAMAGMGDEFKLSVNDILLKAVASALTQHPEVNAHWLGDRIRQFNRVHIGMAVAIEEGLITPVIFDADQKGLRAISAEARDLAARARGRKLKPEEYTGSTFSISNLGMLGIDQFTAIINPPESAILAVGAIEEKAVVENGAVVPRKRMRITLSCDHRVIDGATGARFLQTLRRMVENPLMLVY